VTRLLPAHAVLAALVVGLAAADAIRLSAPGAAFVLAACGGVAWAASAPRLALALACALALGWWWGSHRLGALDRSVLAAEDGRSARALVEVTSTPRIGPFGITATARVRRFDRRPLSEPVELELPSGRAPPQGAVLAALAVVQEPRGPENGFDERQWLQRQGIHVVLRVDAWRAVGRRGGLRGRADALRRWLRRASGAGLSGEREAVVEGVLLGDDAALSPGLKTAFQRSGLYHLLAVSGQNVVLLVGGILVLARLAGVPRAAAHVAGLVALVLYVVAVGPQPSVIRAAVSGAAASTAWLVGRERDRWQILGLGAAVLLAWNPYLLFDAGFQLSFLAVAALFLAVGPLVRVLEGYPLPGKLGAGIAASLACSVATAPILLLQFGRVPLLGVVANALAEPAVPVLLSLAFGAAAVQPLSPALAAALAWLNGWVAAYVSLCARVVAAVPFAQARGAAADVAVAGTLLAAAYAWRRWRTS
jgi:competence protein ComEC